VASSLSALPRLGSGAGYRRSWESWLHGGPAGVGWVEVVVERCLDLPEDDRARLRRLAGTVQVVPHGVEAAFDVPGDPDPAAVEAGAALAAEWSAPWFSGHLYPSRRRAEPLREWAREQGRRAQRLQDGLGVPFLVEVAEYDMAEVVGEVLDHCDCGLILNLAMLWQARERGVDPSGYLDRLPRERVVEVHLTTGDARAGAVEEHTRPVAGPVWDMFADLVASGQVRASVVERDGDQPRDLAELAADVDRARAVFDGHAPIA
jgi:uncharacterized protein (UPF0276 family)